MQNEFYAEDYISCNSEFLEGCLGSLEDNIVSILKGGSASREEIIPGWSDLDYLIVLKKMDFESQAKIRDQKLAAQQKYGIKLGICVVGADELSNSEKTWYRMTFKNMPFLITSETESTVEYGDDIRNSFELTENMVQKDALNFMSFNFEKFKRKVLDLKLGDNGNLRKTLYDCIKICFSSVKMGVRYFSNPADSEKPFNDMIMELYPDFDMDTYEHIRSLRINWRQDNSSDFPKAYNFGEEKLMENLEISFNFLVRFNEQFYGKVEP